MSRNESWVVIVALAGPNDPMLHAAMSAVASGMRPVVLVPSTKAAAAETKLNAQLGRAQPQPILVSLRIRTFTTFRSSLRRTLIRVSDALGILMRRAMAAFRVRTPPGRRFAGGLTSAETRVERLPTRITSAIVNILVDSPLLLFGRLMTGSTYFLTLNRLVDRLRREGRLVGVVCLDGKSLVPGWLVSRLHPEVPVLTAYPNDWTRDLVDSLERFDMGTKWI
jgi:hypothetical protein